jgi:glycosyltransferase involved in cell wall biosynthesis
MQVVAETPGGGGREQGWPLSLSIVTSAHNEVGNVVPFLSSTVDALRQLNVSAEILYIDDGSSDGTAAAVSAFAEANPGIPIRLIRHAFCRGITTAIQESIEIAQGDLMCFVPADMESNPAVDVPLLYQAMDGQTDVVVGCRQGRRDGKVFASRIYNTLNYWLFSIRLRDANWIRLIRHDKLQDLQLRSDWHRFVLPILGHKGCRFKEVETQWQQRSFGRSNFGLKRFPVSLADMLAIKFLLVYGERPLLFFGWGAFLSTGLSLLLFLMAFLFGSGNIAIFLSFLVLGAAAGIAAALSLGLGFAGELVLGWRPPKR